MTDTIIELGKSLGLLAFALAVLLYSAERLVGASEEIGISMGVPPFLMGLTVLAVGTSLPELVTGLFAVFDGNGEIVVGTVMGSNIANILLILGVAAYVAKEFSFDWDLLHGDIPMLFGSVMLMAFFIYPVSTADYAHFTSVMSAANGDTSVNVSHSASVTFIEGLFLLGGYVLYLYYYTQRNPNHDATKPVPKENRPPIHFSHILWIIFGLVGVPIGANYTVEAAVDIAGLLGVGKSVVAASMIAIGTSLPELVVSVSAIRRKNYEMALGNVTGSNIFNSFVVLGVPALFAPYVGNQRPLEVGEPSILALQLPYYAATMLLFLVVVLDKKFTRTEGLMILTAYVIFIAKLFSAF